MAEQVKQFKLRLPSAPDFRGTSDESYALTCIKAYTEILTGTRYTIHSLICELIEQAPSRGFTLSPNKRPAIPANASTERIDMKLNQKQIDALDYLRDELAKKLTNMSVFDARGYYERYEVIREVIHQELPRITKAHEEQFYPGASKTPPMHGKPWSLTDDEFLSHTWSRNQMITAKTVGLTMGRGEGAIISRLMHLKLYPDLESAQAADKQRQNKPKPTFLKAK